MSCAACAEQSRAGIFGLCREHQIERAARGPWFFASLRAGKILPQYEGELIGIFGAGCDPRKADLEVRAAAQKGRA